MLLHLAVHIPTSKQQYSFLLFFFHPSTLNAYARRHTNLPKSHTLVLRSLTRGYSSIKDPPKLNHRARITTLLNSNRHLPSLRYHHTCPYKFLKLHISARPISARVNPPGYCTMPWLLTCLHVLHEQTMQNLPMGKTPPHFA